MAVSRGTNLCAAAAVACLLESDDLKFSNVLYANDANVVLSSSHNEIVGFRGEIRWSAQMETRDWGIKDIVFSVDKFAMDVTLAGGEQLAVEWPSTAAPKASDALYDPDTLTHDDALELAEPEWKVEVSVNNFSRNANGRIERTRSIRPSVHIDFDSYLIEVEF